MHRLFWGWFVQSSQSSPAQMPYYNLQTHPQIRGTQVKQAVIMLIFLSRCNIIQKKTQKHSSCMGQLWAQQIGSLYNSNPGFIQRMVLVLTLIVAYWECWNAYGCWKFQQYILPPPPDWPHCKDGVNHFWWPWYTPEALHGSTTVYCKQSSIKLLFTRG